MKIVKVNGTESERIIKTIQIEIGGSVYKIKENNGGLMVNEMGGNTVSIEPYSCNAFRIVKNG